MPALSAPPVPRPSAPSLGAGELLLRAVVAPLSVYALRLDADGTLTYANDALLAATGWAADEVLGAEWGEGLLPARGGARSLLRAAVGGAVARGEGAVCTRDGARRRVAWDAVAVQDADGRSAGALLVGRDVTAERALAREGERLARVAAEQAEHDALTGVLNARGFARVTEHALRVAARTSRVDALVAVRLRALVPAAAEHGRAAADDAVCAAAETLQAAVRNSDLVARVADDAFVVYAVGTGYPGHGEAAARRLRAALAAQDARARGAGRGFDLECAVAAVEREPGDAGDALLARALAAADAEPRPGEAPEAAWEGPGGGEGWFV